MKLFIKGTKQGKNRSIKNLVGDTEGANSINSKRFKSFEFVNVLMFTYFQGLRATNINYKNSEYIIECSVIRGGMFFEYVESRGVLIILQVDATSNHTVWVPDQLIKLAPVLTKPLTQSLHSPTDVILVTYGAMYA